jgi:predicted RNase H-like HicB family nuclease
MRLTIETEQERDGRWIAEIMEIPGALVYGTTRAEAIAVVQALALRVLADRLEADEDAGDLLSLEFVAA